MSPRRCPAVQYFAGCAPHGGQLLVAIRAFRNGGWSNTPCDAGPGPTRARQRDPSCLIRDPPDRHPYLASRTEGSRRCGTATTLALARERLTGVSERRSWSLARARHGGARHRPPCEVRAAAQGLNMRSHITRTALGQVRRFGATHDTASARQRREQGQKATTSRLSKTRSRSRVTGCRVGGVPESASPGAESPPSNARHARCTMVRALLVLGRHRVSAPEADRVRTRLQSLDLRRLGLLPFGDRGLSPTSCSTAGSGRRRRHDHHLRGRPRRRVLSSAANVAHRSGNAWWGWRAASAPSWFPTAVRPRCSTSCAEPAVGDRGYSAQLQRIDAEDCVSGRYRPESSSTPSCSRSLPTAAGRPRFPAVPHSDRRDRRPGHPLY